eukprot:7439264-Alexandrium_andersonii.AAC.1
MPAGMAGAEHRNAVWFCVATSSGKRVLLPVVGVGEATRGNRWLPADRAAPGPSRLPGPRKTCDGRLCGGRGLCQQLTWGHLSQYGLEPGSVDAT